MQFSFSRFKYLFKLQLAGNRRLYLLSIAALAGLLLSFMFFAAFSFDRGLSIEVQIDFLTAALLLSATFFGSMIFKQYGEKDERIQSMLLPVSNTEKLAVAILFTFVIFPVVFFLVYFLCLMLANAVDVHFIGRNNKIGMIAGYERSLLLMLFVFVQSAVLLCAIWFRRQTFVKTVVTVVVLFFAVTIMNDVIKNAVLKDVGEKTAVYTTANGKPLGLMDPSYYKMLNSSPFQSIRYQSVNTAGYNTNIYYWISLPDNQRIPFLLLLGIIPFFFFYVTALKLREQQL